VGVMRGVILPSPIDLRYRGRPSTLVTLPCDVLDVLCAQLSDSRSVCDS